MSKILKLQNDLQNLINNFVEIELNEKEYLRIEVKNIEIVGSGGSLFLTPEIKVFIGINK